MRWRLVGADVERRVGRAEEGERRRVRRARRRNERSVCEAERAREERGTWAGEWSEQAKGQRERVQVDAVATAGNKAAVWARCAGARSRGKKGTTNQRSQPRLWTRAWYEARRQLGRQKEEPIFRVLCACSLNAAAVSVPGAMGTCTCEAGFAIFGSAGSEDSSGASMRVLRSVR